MKKKNINQIIIAVILLIFSTLYYLITKGVIFENIKVFLEEKETCGKIFKGINAVSIGVLLFIISHFIIIIGKKSKNATVNTITLLLGNIFKYLSIFGIVIAILSICGIDTTAIITASGVLALIIGFGCQSLVSDIVAGIFMIIEGDIKVGDVVVINEWRGTIKQIGLRRTKIEDFLGNVNIICNSKISNIINNTKKYSYAICDVGIEYNESIERVESIFSEHLKEFKEHIPTIIDGPFYKGVTALGQSSVNIRIVAKCNEQDKLQVERDINREIKLLFDRYNINIPFTQVVLNYRDQNETATVPTNAEIAKAKEFVDNQKQISGTIEKQEE